MFRAMACKVCAAVFAAVVTAAVSAAGRPFSYYQPIIDRCPFGEGPDDPSVPPENAPRGGGRNGDAGETPQDVAQAQMQLERSVSVSVINITPDGRTMAGFTDAGDSKSPRHYYIEKGETKGGWTLKDVDPVEKRITLVKDGIEIERTLGEAAAGGAQSAGRRGPQTTTAGQRTVDAAVGMKSHRAMKRERDEAERRARLERAEADRKRAEEEELRREEDKVQREAEREEMHQNLLNMQEQLRKVREENNRRREEGGQDEQDRQADAEDNP